MYSVDFKFVFICFPTGNKRQNKNLIRVQIDWYLQTPLHDVTFPVDMM